MGPNWRCCGANSSKIIKLWRLSRRSPPPNNNPRHPTSIITLPKTAAETIATTEPKSGTHTLSLRPANSTVTKSIIITKAERNRRRFLCSRGKASADSDVFWGISERFDQKSAIASKIVIFAELYFLLTLLSFYKISLTHFFNLLASITILFEAEYFLHRKGHWLECQLILLISIQVNMNNSLKLGLFLVSICSFWYYKDIRRFLNHLILSVRLRFAGEFL